MRKQHDRVAVLLFWLLMLCTFLINAFRKQQSPSAPSAPSPKPANTNPVADPVTDPASQELQSSQPGKPAYPESLVDSGMIEVALVIATVGFLIYQFGDDLLGGDPEIDLLFGFVTVTIQQVGKVVVFVGIVAALLLHGSFWDVWGEHYNRKSGRLNKVAIPVLIGHATIYVVLFVAMGVAAFFIAGPVGMTIASWGMVTFTVFLWTRKS
jgi:hypothetical protein